MVNALLKKYRREILLGFILTSVFFLSRIIHLTQMPIFTDEAIYLRWAQIAKNDANWRFISLTDGKQPLFVWLTIVVMKFISDPLLAGRLVSTGAGFLTMVGMGFLGYELFQSRRAGFLSAFLYLILPFSLVYDRMALMDALVGTFAVWSLYFATLLVKNSRLDLSLILGAVLGGGVLTKTSGFLNIYLLPSTLLLFKWRDKKWPQSLAKLIMLGILAIIISQLFYNILRLSPWFNMIAQKDTTFVYPFWDWIYHPFTFFWGNLRGLFDWLKNYLTWPILILIIGSLVLIHKNLKEKLLLFIWFAAPFVALALFGKVLYPRFIFFMSLPLLVLAAAFLDQIFSSLRNKVVFLTILLALFAYPLFFDWQILANLYKAPIPKSDSGQYLNDWPAGGGVKEAVSFFQEQAKKGKIAIFTEGTFGLMPYSLELYLVDHPNIELKGIWPVEEISDEVLKKAGEKPTFFVFNETQGIPQNWPLRLLDKYPKGKSNVFLRIFAIEPPQVK